MVEDVEWHPRPSASSRPHRLRRRHGGGFLMAEPLPTVVRLPLDTATARAAVDSTVRLLAQLSEVRQKEPAWKEAMEAARALHLDLAGAEFDARLPGKVARGGGE